MSRARSAKPEGSWRYVMTGLDLCALFCVAGGEPIGRTEKTTSPVQTGEPVFHIFASVLLLRLLINLFITAVGVSLIISVVPPFE